MRFNEHNNKTADGKVVVEGMTVVDYDRMTGTVMSDTTSPTVCDKGYCRRDHWFRVKRTDGSVRDFNGGRMITAVRR